MIAIVDYGMGNLGSVKKAFDFLGAKSKVTDKASVILSAEKIVFPGVGGFRDAMEELDKRQITEILKKEIANKKPFLGLCLGVQLLFEESEEAPGVKGLAVFKGNATKFQASRGFKVPQIGWNELNITAQGKKCPFLKGIENGTFVYFVHSYYVEPEDKKITAATSDYKKKFTACVWKDNVFACQFHPEKSQKAGLKILENFCNL